MSGPSLLRFAAVDLGAESGRVVLGRLEDDRVTLGKIHRFANEPLFLPDGLRWDVSSLFLQTLRGLAAASGGGRLDSVGVDSWGCDCALLGSNGRMLGLPFHYRDARHDWKVVQETFARVGRSELYARTGTQTMPINTIFQLQTERARGVLSRVERIALISDLIGFWLTGHLENERTIASTTGLLDVAVGSWAKDLVERLGLPLEPFAENVVEPGTELGHVRPEHRDAGAAVGSAVHVVASHDTASAFVATPLQDEHSAVLSSGTWSLLGVETTHPEVGELAMANNLTNERGVAGTTRLLRNVMGLWLLQECRRVWREAGVDLSYAELERRARRAGPDTALFDPDHETLLHRGDMPMKIARLCEVSGQAPPRGPGEMCRAIFTSLACRYRMVFAGIEQVIGRRINVVHVVGGGARNELLCQLTADLLCRPLLAGPDEATATGNLLVQAMAIGAIEGLSHARAVSRKSFIARAFEPEHAGWGNETYERFLAAIEPVSAGVE